MTKVKRISVLNLKAVSSLTQTFDGCTAIITGRNNSGKTSFLRGLFDRVRGTKPDEPLKQGEEQGFAECELTSGEKIKWEFNNKGKEKLTFVTEKEIKTPLTVELRSKYLPETFDVDKFLLAQPKQQRKTLQDLVGLDFADIDKRYDEAYKSRALYNAKYSDAKTIFDAAPVPKEVKPVDVNALMLEKDAERLRLNTLYKQNKAHNDKVRKDWQDECDKVRSEVDEFNYEQQEKSKLYSNCNASLQTLLMAGYTGDAQTFVAKLYEDIKPVKTYIAPVEPTYIEELPSNADLLILEEKINAANETNRQAQVYVDWTKQRDKLAEAKQQAADANTALTAIEKERTDLIKTAKMPEGFAFTDEGITYNGLAFTREQLSSSGLYIAALKLAAMTLGEIKTLHFDASFLDKVSLGEIEKWATEQDLQLLIERPDFEAGEIQYELINNTTES